MKQIIVNNISTYYYITEDGRCYNQKTNNYLIGQTGKNGYKTYQIRLPDGTKKRLYAHRLVAEAYPSKSQNKREIKSHVYCFNKDKELVAEYQNIAQACSAAGISQDILQQELRKEVKALSGGFYWSKEKKLGPTKDYFNRGRTKEVFQYSLKGKYINKYKSLGEAARSLGLSSCSHIGECCRGKIDSYKGFIWRYADDIVSTSNESQRDVRETS